jgi:hypothetical protein
VTSILGGEARIAAENSPAPRRSTHAGTPFARSSRRPGAILRLTRDSRLLRILAEADDDHHGMVLELSIGLLFFIILAL